MESWSEFGSDCNYEMLRGPDREKASYLALTRMEHGNHRPRHARTQYSIPLSLSHTRVAKKKVPNFFLWIRPPRRRHKSFSPDSPPPPSLQRSIGSRRPEVQASPDLSDGGQRRRRRRRQQDPQRQAGEDPRRSPPPPPRSPRSFRRQAGFCIFYFIFGPRVWVALLRFAPCSCCFVPAIRSTAYVCQE